MSGIKEMLNQLQAQAAVGYKTDVAGRDMVKTTTNESKIFYWLIMGGVFLISTMGGWIMYLLKGNRATKKWLQNMCESKKRYKEKCEKLENAK